MNHYQKFENAVSGMNIPADRKSANSQNALWFLRQGVPLNREHPKIMTAIFHARHIN